MTRLTEKQGQEIAQLREERGWSYRRIALRYGVSTSAVHHQCLRRGAVSPTPRAPRRVGPLEMVGRDGRTLRRFTQAEDERLLQLEAEGLGLQQIAEHLGRHRSSIRVRLLALALRGDGYAAAPTPIAA